MFSLAILTFCDVFGRRFFNSPVAGTIEIVEFGIALVAFLAMPRAFFLNAHVSADFIKNIDNKRLQNFITFFLDVNTLKMEILEGHIEVQE